MEKIQWQSDLVVQVNEMMVRIYGSKETWAQDVWKEYVEELLAGISEVKSSIRKD